MAYTTIPNLPLATSLTGSEQLEVVQNGVSVKTTTGALGTLNTTAGTVTLVNTNYPLTGGPITNTGAISLATGGVTNDFLANMPSLTLKGNIAGSSAPPTDVTIAQLISVFGLGTVSQIDTGVGLTGGPITTTGTISLSTTTVGAGTYGSPTSVGQFTVDAYGRLTSAVEQIIAISPAQVSGLGTMATQNANSVAITGGSINSTSIGAITPSTATFTSLNATGTTTLNVVAAGTWNGSAIDIAYGGTGATTATAARTNLSAAKSGVNSDITSLTGLTTPISPTQGGTGFSAYTQGDLIYADAATSLARLNDVAVGNALISGGVGVAPSYGKIGLTTHVSGTLPIASGGTGQTSASSAFNALSPITTTGDLIIGNGSNSATRLPIGANSYILTSDGTTAYWGVAPATGVTSISFGSTGFTPSTATTGVVTVAGTLNVSNGGTGATTLTGFVKGNGTSAFTAQATIGNSDLTNSSITIGSTAISLGGTASTISGLTTLTLTQDPTSALQASTKQYVDNQVATVANLTYHTSVGYATTADLGSVTYSNGTGGVGATITNAGTQAALTIDGYTFTATDVTNATRVLVKDETNGAYNGIYTVTNQGSLLTNWELTRAVDFDSTGTGPDYIQTGSAAFVSGGTVNGSTSWVMTTTGTINVGSTSLTWSQISSSGNIAVSAPLIKTGNTISLGTVGVTNGGTGLTSYTAYGLLYAPTTTSIGQIGTGTSGYPLLSNGAGSAPSFGQLSLTAGVTGTLPIANGGTGQTSASAAFNALSPITTTGDLILGNGANSATRLAIGSNGYVLTSNGTTASWAAPAATGVTSFQTSLSGLTPSSSTTGAVTLAGTLGVTSGGTGTTTQFTTGSVVFAGASGVYSQSNTKLFWDNTNNRLGINTASPNANFTIVSNTQTASPVSAASLPSGTDLYILGANNANTRITQDAYGLGAYPAYTGRQARGTAASPTASQTDDILVEVTGRGYGATAFSSASVVRIDMEAAENFTDTAQGTYISLHTTALGSVSPAERFRVGPSGQFGIGGATYGTSGYALVSGGASAAPSWSQISLTAGVSGTLPATNGGTGQSSYTTGDILYASSSSALSKLAAVATGNVLLSQGVGTAPAWGQVNLASAVTGTLPILNGGTGQTTASAAFNALSPITSTGDLIIGSGTNSATRLAIGTNNYVLTSNGSTATWAATQSTMVYPGAGIPNSTGSAWGTSYSTSGSGTVVALATSPSFTTPTLGVASATSINKVAITAPATSATLTIADGKTLTASNSITIAGTDGKTATFSNSITFAGTDSTTMTFPSTSDAVTAATNTQTLTNKRVTPRVSSTTSVTSPLAWNSDNFDQYAYTALANALTISADAGTPTDGQKMIFRFLDNGTARVLTFTGGTSKGFEPVSVSMTTSGSNFTYTTTASKLVYFGCIYNSGKARWDVVAISQEA